MFSGKRGKIERTFSALKVNPKEHKKTQIPFQKENNKHNNNIHSINSFIFYSHIYIYFIYTHNIPREVLKQQQQQQW